jgi:hypothetical protein
MSRTRAADDFDAIRDRMRELKGEARSAPAGGVSATAAQEPAPVEEWIPDAVAHCPPGMRRRPFPERYHRSSCP